MSNIITYTLLLQDRMSGILQKVGVSANQSRKGVDDLGKSANNLNKVNVGGFLSSIGKIAGVLGVGVLLGKTIKTGMEQEMRNTSFEVLFGGVDNAKKMIDEISGYAAKSPYGKVGLSEATQMMAGYQIAQEKIIPNLKMIGDIAMGNEDKFKSLSLSFAQTSSAGKLTGENLNQMINAGFNPLSEMAKTTGKSISQLKVEMEKGAISTEMVTAAFQSATGPGGLYYDMVNRINNTVGGQWAAAQESIAEKLLSLYNNVLQPVLLPALKQFNQFLEDPIGSIGRLVDKFTTDFPVITGLIVAATGALLGYRAVLFSITVAHLAVAAWTKILAAYEIVVFAVKNATSIWAAAQWLLNVAMDANPVGVIIAAVVALIAVIVFLVKKINGWGEAWKHTVNGAKLIFLAYVEYVKASFNTVVDGIMIGINKIKEGWYSFKQAVGIGDSSENEKMLAQIQADTEARKQSIADGWKKTADLTKQAGQEFVNAAKSFSWGDATYSGVAAEIGKKMGISPAGVPGTENAAAVAGMGEGGGMGGGKGKGGKTGMGTAESIATGGTKTTHITVNIAEMGNDMKIYANSLREGAANMRDMILDELTRALSMAQGQAV
ncbi:MAG: tape measure protein [Tannerella sp.]|jgi:tape measure domain-containing protein|nr:tape measure protein [Tannerella sp.]